MKKRSSLLLGFVAAAFIANASAASAQEGDCLQQFSDAFARRMQEKPQNHDWGMHDTYKYTEFLGVQGLELLENYRGCMTDSEYQANRQQLEIMRDQGRQGCEQTASGSGTCTPDYPG